MPYKFTKKEFTDTDTIILVVIMNDTASSYAARGAYCEQDWATMRPIAGVIKLNLAHILGTLGPDGLPVDNPRYLRIQ